MNFPCSFLQHTPNLILCTTYFLTHFFRFNFSKLKAKLYSNSCWAIIFAAWPRGRTERVAASRVHPAFKRKFTASSCVYEVTENRGTKSELLLALSCSRTPFTDPLLQELGPWMALQRGLTQCPWVPRAACLLTLGGHESHPAAPEAASGAGH